MRRLILPAVVLLTLAGVVWIGGLRLFVLSPNDETPHGTAALVWGVPALHLVDSPDSFCARELGDVSSMCRKLAVRKVSNNATVLTRLPYLPLFDWLAGTPEIPAVRPVRYDV